MINKKLDIGQILQDLYNSEINFAVESPLWDDGFQVSTGGCKTMSGGYGYASALRLATIDEAVKHLVEKVIEIYPDSKFAKKYKVNEVAIIEGIKQMGMESLNPDSFADLERVISELRATRSQLAVCTPS